MKAFLKTTECEVPDLWKDGTTQIGFALEAELSQWSYTSWCAFGPSEVWPGKGRVWEPFTHSLGARCWAQMLTPGAVPVTLGSPYFQPSNGFLKSYWKQGAKLSIFSFFSSQFIHFHESPLPQLGFIPCLKHGALSLMTSFLLIAWKTRHRQLFTSAWPFHSVLYPLAFLELSGIDRLKKHHFGTRESVAGALDKRKKSELKQSE